MRLVWGEGGVFVTHGAIPVIASVRTGLAFLAMAFLLGRLSISDVLWPFGPAFLAAVLTGAAGATPGKRGAAGFLTVAAGIALGSWSAGQLPIAIAHCLFALVSRYLYHTRLSGGMTSGGTTSPVAPYPLIAVSALLAYGVPALWQMPDLTTLFNVLFQVILILIAYEIYSGSLQALDALVTTPTPLGLAEQVFLGLLGMSLAAGLTGLSIGPIDLRAAAQALAVCVAGWWGGAAAGAAVGVAGGTVATLVGQAGGAEAMGIWGLAGLLAGLFGRWGRVATALWAVIGLGLGWLAGGKVPDAGMMGGPLAGITLFLLAPLGFRAGRSPEPPPGQPKPGVLPAGVRDRILALADVFGELGRTIQQQAATVWEPGEEVAFTVNRLATGVCRDCGRYGDCWERNFLQYYRVATDLISRVVTEPVEAATIREAWGNSCSRPEVMAVGLNLLVEMRERERLYRLTLAEKRGMVAGHLLSVARVLDDLPREPLAPDQPGVQRHGLEYATDVAKLAREGRVVSGDSHLVRELPGGVLLLIVSDGMGNGSRAALESRAATALVTRLIEAGFAAASAIRLVNAALFLRSPDESFATLDIVRVELGTGQAEFIKVGAAPSFVSRGGRVLTVPAGGPPLGILDDVDVEPYRTVLGPGDTLVMVTDGLLDGQGDLACQEGALQALLGRFPVTGEPGLARSIMEEVARKLPGERRDDMTVLAVRFWRRVGCAPPG